MQQAFPDAADRKFDRLVKGLVEERRRKDLARQEIPLIARVEIADLGYLQIGIALLEEASGFVQEHGARQFPQIRARDRFAERKAQLLVVGEFPSRRHGWQQEGFLLQHIDGIAEEVRRVRCLRRVFIPNARRNPQVAEHLRLDRQIGRENLEAGVKILRRRRNLAQHESARANIVWAKDNFRNELVQGRADP